MTSGLRKSDGHGRHASSSTDLPLRRAWARRQTGRKQDIFRRSPRAVSRLDPTAVARAETNVEADIVGARQVRQCRPAILFDRGFGRRPAGPPPVVPRPAGVLTLASRSVTPVPSTSFKPEVIFVDLFGTIFRWDEENPGPVAERAPIPGRTRRPAEVSKKQRGIGPPPAPRRTSTDEFNECASHWRHIMTGSSSKLKVKPTTRRSAAIRRRIRPRHVKSECSGRAAPLKGLKEAHARLASSQNATLGCWRDFSAWATGPTRPGGVLPQAVNARKPDAATLS